MSVNKTKILDGLSFLAEGLKKIHELEFNLMDSTLLKEVDRRLRYSFSLISGGLILFGIFYHFGSMLVETQLDFLVSYQALIKVFHLSNILFLITQLVFFQRLTLNENRLMLTLSMLGGIFMYSILGKSLLETGYQSIYLTLTIVMVYAFGIGLIAVFPYSGWFSNGILMLLIWSQAILMIWNVADFTFALCLTTFVFGVTYTIKLIIWTLIMNYLDQDIIQKQKIFDTERALTERDLDLARKIQDSIAPPRELIWRNHLVHCWVHKNAVVGGDWVGIHVDRSGALNVVVADAMGKGLQAALVIHAVQSLWAQVIDKEQVFDPHQWIKNVNKSLFYMGQNATHFVTMGILRIEQNAGTYWSAGHVPLFWISKGLRPTCGSVLPAGSPLGISEVPLISSRPFDTHNVSRILLGTDGVFHKGSRHTHREILDLGEKISSQGPQLLANISIVDDKTLVVVHKQRDWGLQEEGDLTGRQPLRKVG